MSYNLKALEWLLEEENPSVRYFTLRDILDKPLDDPEVILAKKRIMEKGAVPKILSLQSTPEYITAFPRFYTWKYKGIVWQLITLAEMGAEINPQIREQCEYMFNNSQEHDDGGFSMHIAKRTGGGRKTEVIPCLTGNMVWALIQFGYIDDPRLQRAIDWLVTYMKFNDGEEIEPQVKPYDRYEICWGKHTCHMAVVKALKGLSAVPDHMRTKEIDNTIEKGVEFLLNHHIFRRSHDLKKKSKPGWLKLSFPLMYQTDILEILDILTYLGVKDDRMHESLDILISKQDEMGKWKAENPSITDKLLLPMEEKGAESKWITYRALRVLKRERSK